MSHNGLGKTINRYCRWGKFFFSNIPSYLIFYITAHCNAKCVHCFNWSLIEEANSRKELSLEEIELITKKWGDLLIVNLSGGEPYLRKDIPEIVEIFRRNTGVEIVALPSNGFLEDRILETINKLLQRFPDIFFRFSFSIDGIGEEHDKIRGVPGGFKMVMRTIEEVKKLKEKYKNFSVLTNSCFLNNNQDNILNTLKFLKDEVGPDASSVTFIRGNARVSAEQQNLRVEKYREVLSYLSELNYQKFSGHPMSKFILGASIYAREKVYENLKTGERNFPCYAIRKMIVVDDIGDVKVCEMLPVTLGNLRENNYDIKEIVTSDFAKAEYQKIKNYECNCTWECAIRTGIIFTPTQYPAIFKSSMRCQKERSKACS